MRWLLSLLCLFSVAASGNCDRIFRFSSDQRFEGFEAERRPPDIFGSRTPLMLFRPLRELPRGMTPAEHRFYEGVFELLRDRHRVFFLLQNLESDIQSLKSEEPRRALTALFKTYEKKFGFGIVTLDEVLSGPEFMRLVRKGNTFMDRNGNRVGLWHNPQLPPMRGRWRHGTFSHRLQLHILLRDFLNHPDRYGEKGTDPLAFYKRLGEPDFQRGLDWAGTGLGSAPRSLFFELFDSAENNGSSPGFYTEYREYWPGIPGL